MPESKLDTRIKDQMLACGRALARSNGGTCAVMSLKMGTRQRASLQITCDVRFQLSAVRGLSYFLVSVNLPFDLIALREEYFTKGLRRIDLDPDPIKEFGIWFTAAVEVGISEMNAMALATVAENGQPTTRMVLLKGYDHDGFVFYTNYLSEKGRHLEKNPRAGLVIHWKELERQIRIDGIAEKVAREESARYFHSRPLGSQLGAWVSHQSDVIDARRILQARLSELEERFAGQEIPCPPYWGGYRVKPERIEFWQGRPNRLHDRFRYTRQVESWRIERLAP